MVSQLVQILDSYYACNAHCTNRAYSDSGLVFGMLLSYDC